MSYQDGNGEDGKHYWLTPPAMYEALNAALRGIAMRSEDYKRSLTPGGCTNVQRRER
jgi:hypothetical protein